MGDQCAHGGSIVVGCPTVLIGEVGGGPGGMAALPVNVLLSVAPSLPPKAKQAAKQIAGMKTAAEAGTPLVHNSMNCSECAKN
jgi:hypothetical protein